MKTTSNNKRRPLWAVFFFILILSTVSVFGQSQIKMGMVGEDKENRARIDGQMKADTDEFETYTVITANTNRLTAFGSYPPMVYDVDLDNDTEIIIIRQDKMQTLDFESNNFIVTETDLTGGRVPVGVPTIEDVDGDGKGEIFVCDQDVGKTDLTGYDFNTSTQTYDIMFQVTLNNPNDQCYNYRAGSSAGTNATYSPTVAQVNGTWYAYWLVRNTYNTGRLYRVAMDGTFTFTAIDNLGEASECDTIYNIVPVISNTLDLTESPHGRHPYNTDVMSMSMCNNDNGDPILYIPTSCIKSGQDVRGITAFRPDTLALETRFGGGFVQVQGTSSALISSPNCAFDGTENAIAVAHGNGFHAISLISDVGVRTEIISSTDSVDIISNVVQGEYLSASFDNADDICGYYVDTADGQLIFQCSEIAETDAGVHVVDVTNITAIGTSIFASGTDSSFTGDENQDIITPFGLWKSVAEDGFLEDDSFELATNNYYDWTGYCTGVDVNEDGFVDVICNNYNNMTLFLANSTNKKPDLISMQKDVTGTMCHGNQTFYVSSAQYTDEELNNVRLRADCFNNNNYTYGPFSSYGSDLSVSCDYSSDGTYTAEICLQDNAHPTDETECILTITQVANTELCVNPDGLASTQIIEDTGDIGEIGDDGIIVQQDLTTSLEQTVEAFGVQNQNSKDFVFVIFAIAIAVAIAGSGSTVFGIGIFTMMLGVFTVAGFIRPIYLIVIIIMGIVGFGLTNAIGGNRGV